MSYSTLLRFAFVAALAAAAANAQVFSDLAVTADGSAAYFTTGHRLRSSTAPAQRRAYVVRTTGGPQALTENPNPTYLPGISATGDVLSYVEKRPPLPPPANSTTPVPVPPLTHVLTRGAEHTFDGEAVLSSDGRYGVIWLDAGLTVADLLETGALTRTRIPYPVLRGRPVNSRGEVAGYEADRIVIRALNGSTSRFLPESKPERIYLDDAGRRILYISATNSTLRSIDRVTLEDRVLQLWVRGDPAVTADGNTVVVLGPSADVNSPYQVILFEGRQQPWAVTDFPVGVDALTITPDGRYVFVTTTVGELVRVEVATLEKQTFITRSPALGEFAYGSRVTPGSLTYLRGRGYTSATEHGLSPLPGPLDGLELWFGTVRAPLNTVQYDQLRFQIPFELPEGEYTVRLHGTDSPFESVGTARVASPAPLLLACNDQGLSLTPSSESIVCALHEDRRTFITATSPARPNENVRLLMLGLGQVDPPMATGVISQANIPRLRVPVTCRYSNSVPFLTPQGLPPFDIFSASLVPGDWGLYYVDVRIPPLEAEFLRIGCTSTPGVDTESKILPMPNYTIRPPRQ